MGRAGGDGARVVGEVTYRQNRTAASAAYIAAKSAYPGKKATAEDDERLGKAKCDYEAACALFRYVYECGAEDQEMPEVGS